MTTALAPVNGNNAIALPAAIEAALIGGDLSKLDQPGRLLYYKAVCESLGLNPLTKPFDYITLNNKLTLYAKRDCTDQLRKIHGVSINTLSAQQLGDVYMVTASAEDRDGRTDTSTGAVATATLKGEALANALMKAETKAKRRVTLSICGLGLLDETEVETVPDAKPFVEQPASQSGPQRVATPQNTAQRPATITRNVSSPKNHLEGNILIVHVNEVLEKLTKPGKDGTSRPYLAIRFDPIDQHSIAFVWHASLFDVLRNVGGKQCQFEVEVSNGRLAIDQVLEIDGQEYRDGKPYSPENSDAEPVGRREEPLVITDDDIPF